MVGMLRNVGKLAKGGDRGWGKMTSDSFDNFGKKLGEMKAKSDAKWAEELKNRDKKVDKAWGEDTKKNESNTKEALANFKKQTGIQMSTSTMLRQSQIFTSSIGAIFQMVGAVIDILLMPLVPLLIPLMQLFSKFVIPVFMQMTLDILRVIKWFKQGFAWATGPNGDIISTAFKWLAKKAGWKSEEEKATDTRKDELKADNKAARDALKTAEEEYIKAGNFFRWVGVENKKIAEDSKHGKAGVTIGQRLKELGVSETAQRHFDYSRKNLRRGSATGFRKDDLGLNEGEMYAMGLNKQFIPLPDHMRNQQFSNDPITFSKTMVHEFVDGVATFVDGLKNVSSSTAEQVNQAGKSWFNMDFRSDSTLKDNVETIPNALEKIESLRGVHFTWKDTNQAQMGVIAQELEQVYPELVHENEEGVKMVEYSSLIGVLIEAVKDLNKQVKLQKVGV